MDSIPPDSSTRHVLVVDDKAMNRDMLLAWVSSLGLSGEGAANGQEGLECISQHAPDAILLDLDMPVMSGKEMLRILMEDEENRHIPVVIISGKDDLETMTDLLSIGVVDFMAKPFKPSILKARLSSSFEKKDLREREQELLHTLEASYEALRKAEEGRDALTHMIVHDLGNPLSVIRMNADLLSMTTAMGQVVSTEALDERLKHISAASESMDLMIRSMLDVSKLESGELEPTLEVVSLGALLREVQVRFTPMAMEKGLSIEVEAPEGAADDPVTLDRLLTERVLANLVSNALKYAVDADRIRLAWQPDATTACLIVEDNGQGIPEELHERVFGKFFQVEASKQGARQGVGLGLAFCRLATETMGGAIRMESATPTGSRFVIELPASLTP